MRKTIISIAVLAVVLVTATVTTFAWLSGISVKNQDRPLILDPSSTSNVGVNYELYRGIDFDYNGVLDKVVDFSNTNVDEDELTVEHYLEGLDNVNKAAYSKVTKTALLTTDGTNSFPGLLPGNIVSFALTLENTESTDMLLDLHFDGLIGDPTLLILKVFNTEVRKYNSSFSTAYYNNSSSHPSQYTTFSSNLSNSHNFEFLKNGELFLHDVLIEANSQYLITYQIQVLNLGGMQIAIDNFYNSYFTAFYENYVLDYLSTTPNINLTTGSTNEKVYIGDTSTGTLLTNDTDYTITKTSDYNYTFLDNSSSKDTNTKTSFTFVDDSSNILVRNIDYTISKSSNYTYKIVLIGQNYFGNHFTNAISLYDTDLSTYKDNINSVITSYIAKYDSGTAEYNLSAYDRSILENIKNIDMSELASQKTELINGKDITAVNADDNTVTVESLVLVLKDIV